MFKSMYEKLYKTKVEAEEDTNNISESFSTQMEDIYRDDHYDSYKYIWRQIKSAPLNREQSSHKELSDALDGVE